LEDARVTNHQRAAPLGDLRMRQRFEDYFWTNSSRIAQGNRQDWQVPYMIIHKIAAPHSILHSLIIVFEP
jgi:hypothetical protein